MADPTNNPTLRHIARITLELRTPLHLGSGKPGDFSDADLVYDANGLPAIPGSSIAGVLRSLAGKQSEHAKDVFGFQNGSHGSQGSRLTVSWACIHDSRNRPVEGIVDPERIDSDEILRLAREPSLRDHVRMTDTGVADAKGHGKFDELSLHIGHRFTFEMELRGTPADRDADARKLAGLIHLLYDPRFRLGGKTRRGFGAVEPVAVCRGSFDTADAGDRARYLKHPVSLEAPSPTLEHVGKAGQDADPFAALDLTPRGFWMFGGGTDVKTDGESDYWKAADMAPVRDAVIEWPNNQAKILENCFMLPASSIKGALAHRTAFHYNCLTGRFIDPDNPEEARQLLEDCRQNNEAVNELFGIVKSKDSGERGHVIIDDAFLPSDTATRRVPHVSIDRFTGGALDGALYDERPLIGGKLQLRVFLDMATSHFDPGILEAFRRALQDVAEGRLALGAGAGRGNGFFAGTIQFSQSTPEQATA
jgi:CRISPR/Cas system CSM-associated protein Csm3 (group 7 of RAMP superfamily)